MPVLTLQCPDCKNIFHGMVFEGTQLPKEWVCSKCGGRDSQYQNNQPLIKHPLEHSKSLGCPCCR